MRIHQLSQWNAATSQGGGPGGGDGTTRGSALGAGVAHNRVGGPSDDAAQATSPANGAPPAPEYRMPDAGMAIAVECIMGAEVLGETVGIRLDGLGVGGQVGI